MNQDHGVARAVIIACLIAPGSGASARHDGTWALRSSAGPGPRYRHHLVYDSGRGVTVLYGGQLDSSRYTDTWEWDGQSWLDRRIAGPLRNTGGMAYDSARGVVLLFGGRGLQAEGDTWEYDGAVPAWTRVHAGDPGGALAPAPRVWSEMAYDESRHVAVLFGGWDGGNTEYGDTWEWDGHARAWSRVHPGDPAGVTAPIHRIGSGFAYDSGRGVCVLYGGSSYEGGVETLLGDTWEWDGHAWTRVHAGDPQGIGAPAPRWLDSQMVYDRGRAVCVLFGGSRNPPDFDETWEYDGAARRWTLKAPGVRPPARYSGGMAYDAGRGAVVLFAGGYSSFQIELGDTWEYGGEECYPDCDTSTGLHVLDIFDFLCFQNRYDAGNPYACDCDTSTGPGVCDIFDFLCFQNAYAAGCP